MILLIAPLSICGSAVLTSPGTRANSAQMITTALNVGSDGAINLGTGPTYGILLVILFTHGVLCSAATAVLARLNLFYAFVNGGFIGQASRGMVIIDSRAQ